MEVWQTHPVHCTQQAPACIIRLSAWKIFKGMQSPECFGLVYKVSCSEFIDISVLLLLQCGSWDSAPSHGVQCKAQDHQKVVLVV